MSRTWTRWMPAAVAALVVAGSATWAGSAQADELPQRTPDEVLTMLAEYDVQPFSGEFEQSSDLGLPQLPGDLPASSGEAAAVSSALEMLTSDHHGRVYVGGEHQLRVQSFDTFGERDLIVNGNQVWAYDSSDNSATHLSVPQKQARRHPGPSTTPQALADQVLAAVQPSTEVSVRENVEVAGRTAYALVLTPRTEDTLVGEVSIAVDGETGMPLRVAITAQGQDQPALEVAYTDLTMSAPDGDLFRFDPPSGADVEQITPPQKHSSPAAKNGKHVFGTGWETVLASAPGAVDLADTPLVNQLTTAVDGGRALSTDLFSVLITPQGQVFLGAVPVERLQAVA